MNIYRQNGFHEAVKVLLEFGANPEASFLGGYGALYIACQNGHGKCVFWLTKFNALVNRVGANGCTGLYVAAYVGRVVPLLYCTTCVKPHIFFPGKMATKKYVKYCWIITLTLR
jgi:ankyrin repeat protein